MDLSCRGSDLRDEKKLFMFNNDEFFDYDIEKSDKAKTENKSKNVNRTGN